MKKILVSTGALLLLLFLQNIYAGTGLFFDVTSVGTADGFSLTIRPTIPAHTYPAIGIKLDTPGFTIANIGRVCTRFNNGFCLFSASHTAPKAISITGPANNANLTLCLNGKGPLSCQHYTASKTGGGGGDNFTVGGTISGLTANGLVLQNNGGDNLTVASGATSFQFSTPVPSGGSYHVTIQHQPASSGCTVSNGSGTNVMANVTNVSISCHSSMAYVANQGNHTVTPINIATNTPGTAITLPAGQPIAIAITPDATTAYVASFSTEVYPINLATNTPGAAITVGFEPQAIAITPDGTKAYTANNGGNSVTPIDLTTNTPGTDIPVGANPSGIAITPDGTTVYVANTGDNTVTPINIATNLPGVPIAVGFGPVAIAITPDGKTAYVVNFFDSTVTPITIATNTPGTPIGVGGGADAIAITPDGTTAYVTSTSNAIVPINTATNTTGTPIFTGDNQQGIAITPDGATAYVTNFNGGGSVTPITLATGTPGANITGGGISQPGGIAIS